MMVGPLGVGSNSSSNLESRTLIFWEFLGSEGLGSEGGWFLSLFGLWSGDLGLKCGGGGSFLLLRSLGLGWLGFS